MKHRSTILIIALSWFMAPNLIRAQERQASTRVEMTFCHIAEALIGNAINTTDNTIIPLSRIPAIHGLFPEHLVKDWSYAEKRELAVLVMVTIPLNGEIAFNFKTMFGKDARQIGRELANIEDFKLSPLMHGHQTSVKSFKYMCAFLEK